MNVNQPKICFKSSSNSGQQTTLFSDVIRLDQETTIVSDKFRNNAKDIGIDLQSSGIVSQSAIVQGEQYHHILRLIFNNVQMEHPRRGEKQILWLTIKEINDKTEPNGPVPSLLVFGFLPYFPTLNSESANKKERLQALKITKTGTKTIVAEIESGQ